MDQSKLFWHFPTGPFQVVDLRVPSYERLLPRVKVWHGQLALGLGGQQPPTGFLYKSRFQPSNTDLYTELVMTYSENFPQVDWGQVGSYGMPKCVFWELFLLHVLASRLITRPCTALSKPLSCAEKDHPIILSTALIFSYLPDQGVTQKKLRCSNKTFMMQAMK